MRVRNVGVVGGGPGGLLTTYFLEKLVNWPVRITLFEATDRLGGKIITPTFDSADVKYEAGAAEFYDYAHFGEDPLKELIAELGLSISVMGGSAVIMNDQILTNSEEIGNHLGPKAVQALREFDQRARNEMTPDEFYNSDHPEGTKGAAHRPFESLLAEIDDPAARKFIDTLIHSDLATEAKRTNVPYGLQNYLMNDADYMLLYGIVGGNEQLPQQLAARINADVRLQHRVTNVFKRGEQMVVRSESEGGQREEEFDDLVIALPHNAIPSVSFDGEALTEAVAKHYDHYHHPAHYLRFTILFDRPFWQSTLSDSFWMLDSFGGCCLYDESSRQPGGPHGVLGWLLGGEEALAMCDWDDDRLIEAALDSLPSFMAEGRDCFIEGKVHRWQGSVNAMPGGIEQANHDRRHQVEPANHPNFYFVGDYLFDSTLNGVIDSAYYVASWISAQTADEAV